MQCSNRLIFCYFSSRRRVGRVVRSICVWFESLLEGKFSTMSKSFTCFLGFVWFKLLNDDECGHCHTVRVVRMCSLSNYSPSAWVGDLCCSHSNTFWSSCFSAMFCATKRSILDHFCGDTFTRTSTHIRSHIPTLYHTHTHACMHSRIASFCNVTRIQLEISETSLQTPQFQFTRKEELHRNDVSYTLILQCVDFEYPVQTVAQCQRSLLFSLSLTANLVPNSMVNLWILLLFYCRKPAFMCLEGKSKITKSKFIAQTLGRMMSLTSVVMSGIIPSPTVLTVRWRCALVTPKARPLLQQLQHITQKVKLRGEKRINKPVSANFLVRSDRSQEDSMINLVFVAF